MITITIHTDNEAFESEPHVEVARILKRLAVSYQTADELLESVKLLDINGNTVGHAVVTDS
jgi:hypothetical protein